MQIPPISKPSISAIYINSYSWELPVTGMPGWIGQIYSGDRYFGRTTRRTKKVGGKNFVEEVLPVASVEEYFQLRDSPE